MFKISFFNGTIVGLDKSTLQTNYYFIFIFYFQLCTNKSMKLENLATVMTLYSRRTFSKESFQWTKCVVKYLYDAYSHLSHNMLAFLVEVSKMHYKTILTFKYISLGVVFVVIQFSASRCFCLKGV